MWLTYLLCDVEVGTISMLQRKVFMVCKGPPEKRKQKLTTKAKRIVFKFIR